MGEKPGAEAGGVELVARGKPVRSDLPAAVLVDHRGLKRREKRPQDDEEGGDAHEGEG